MISDKNLAMENVDFFLKILICQNLLLEVWGPITYNILQHSITMDSEDGREGSDRATIFCGVLNPLRAGGGGIKI